MRSSFASPCSLVGVGLLPLLLVLGLPPSLACSKAPAPAPVASGPVTVAPTGGAVNITADAKGFTPSEVHATKGAPLSLVFTRTSDNTCATEVVFPELKVRKELRFPLILATNGKTGTSVL